MSASTTSQESILFGLQLHPQYTTWDEMAAAARLVEETGWDVLMTWDHFVPLVGDVTGPNFEGWQVLAAFAAMTERVQIAMLVTGNTYRHPAVLANMASTLDHISHGRAVLGIGAAWNEHEHNMYGIPFDTPGIRLAKLAEAATIIRGLLDEGTVTFVGKHYQLTNATLGTRPVQKRLPILVGGGGEQKTLRITARHADWWHGFGDAAVIRHKLEVLRRHCEEVGRDPSKIMPTAGGSIFVTDDPNAIDARTRAMMQRNRAASINPIANSGSPDKIAARLVTLYEAGIRGFLFGMTPPYDQATIERAMTEVKPRFLELIGA
ncbi:MAG TPA: TIGR03560 family F420-dependent LLM class oxidoreductase [Candidatus Limnocylindria bacterium]|jgi:F420-dependent oxidoreductase-like protein